MCISKGESRMSSPIQPEPNEDVLNVDDRLAQQRSWMETWQKEEQKLREELEGLDPSDPSQRGRGNQIVQEIDQLTWKRIQIPIEISPLALKILGFEEARRRLSEQFAALSEDDRLLWLDNFRFLKTPSLRQLEEKFNDVRTCDAVHGQRRNFLLGGSSGMGKTTSEEWYAYMNPPVAEPTRNHVPVI